MSREPSVDRLDPVLDGLLYPSGVKRRACGVSLRFKCRRLRRAVSRGPLIFTGLCCRSGSCCEAGAP
jgi:hypothetical protein